MSYTIIDRRLNPGGKNLSNRQRFLKRAKEQLRKSVKDGLLERSITSTDDQNVTVPADGIKEPSFSHDPETGNREFVVPGNTEFIPGDVIDKPPKNGDSGGEGSPDGEGEDCFDFPISKDEFNEILFEDLELPNLAKTSMKQTVTFTKVRAGFVNDGTPCNLDLQQSMRRSLGRRIALKKPKLRRIKKLEEELNVLLVFKFPTIDQTTRINELEDEIKRLRIKANAISFLDPIDLRFRNYENKPTPKHKAVMFCIMDVSASMGEHEKDLAKRFYLLLYMFLNYKYDTVDVVFIRHHSRATECTEEEFFYSRETGGTVVSEGFKEMTRIQKERYNVDEWNMYVAQASDGDNFGSDNARLKEMIIKEVLPIVQYFAYIEVSNIEYDREALYGSGASNYGLWPVYREIQEEFPTLEMKKVQDPRHVYSVFRELFKKDTVQND